MFKMKKQSPGMWILCVIGLLIILMSVTTSTNFEYYTVSGNEPNSDLGSSPVFALFEKKGCPHCETFRPTWEKFKEINSDGEVNIKSFEASDNPDIMSKHNISGFPTIRMYPNGMDKDHKEFNGERTIDSLQSFIDGTQGGGVFGKASMQNNNEYEIQSTIASNDVQSQGRVDNIEGYSNIEYFDLQAGCEFNNDQSSCEINNRCQWDASGNKCRNNIAPRGILNEMGGGDGGGNGGNEIGQVDTATDM